MMLLVSLLKISGSSVERFQARCLVALLVSLVRRFSPL